MLPGPIARVANLKFPHLLAASFWEGLKSESHIGIMDLLESFWFPKLAPSHAAQTGFEIPVHSGGPDGGSGWRANLRSD